MGNRRQEGAGSDGAQSRQHKLTVTLVLSLMVLVVEVVGAWLTDSLALLVDSAHMLTDVGVLAAATVTSVLMRRRPDNRRTWGWARLEVITAGLGALVLLIVGIYALVEAVMRIAGVRSDEVQAQGLLLGFGVLGLCSNVLSALLLADRRSDNMNMKAAFLETVNDAMGSLAVIISAVVMMLTGWSGFDAVAGAVIAVLIIPRAFTLIRNAFRVLLEETPEELDLDEVRRHIKDVDHVIGVHDLHASTVATGTPTLSAHVVIEDGLDERQESRILRDLKACLAQHFPIAIAHTTFQLEPQSYRSEVGELAHR